MDFSSQLLISQFSKDLIIGLVSVSGIGPKTTLNILGELKNSTQTIPEDIWVTDLLKFQLKCITKKQYQAIKKFANEHTRSSFTNWLVSQQTFGLVLGEKNYPTELLKLADPPLVLFVTHQSTGRHSTNVLPTKKLTSVVGTRHPSLRGRIAAERVGWWLGMTGYSVVSGCMYGVDALCQQTALAAGSEIVGVLGHGWGCQLSDRAEAQLWDWLGRGAWFVSEWPPGTTPYPGLFIQRNRLIAALGKSTLVVEAGLQSGSWHTARAAQLIKKPVFILDNTSIQVPPKVQPQKISLNDYLSQFKVTKSKSRQLQSAVPANLIQTDSVLKANLKREPVTFSDLQNQMRVFQEKNPQPLGSHGSATAAVLAYLRWLSLAGLANSIGGYWYAVGKWGDDCI